MKNLFALLAFVLLVIAKASAQTTIPAKDAAKHIGETVTIADKVYAGKLITLSNMIVLDAGGYSPNQKLTIVIPAGERYKFTSHPEIDFCGKEVIVSGKLLLHKNKPEIVVTDPKHLKLVLVDNARGPIVKMK